MPNAECVQLAQAVRTFLGEVAPESELLHWVESDRQFDPLLWSRAANEIGIQGLAIAERFGGAEAGLPALGLCFEELGRALVGAPFLSTVGLAATVLAGVTEATDPRSEILTAIAGGTGIAALAWGGQDPVTSTLVAEPAPGAADEVITGVADVVIDGYAADLLLAVARDRHDDVNVYLVRTPFEGVTRTTLTALDLTRRIARVEFDRAPAAPVLVDASTALARARDTAWLLLAAEQLGGAQRTLDMAVDYAKTRHQFGRAIGSFQAVKHQLADMLVQVESARSVVYHALHSADADPDTVALEAALARSVASDAFLRCAAANLQIHGGMGFTWEHPAHLFLKRAKSSSLLFDSPVRARRRLAEELDLVSANRPARLRAHVPA